MSSRYVTDGWREKDESMSEVYQGADKRPQES